MIYVCVVARDHASTVGLLLWKVRQVLADLSREYQLLVVDDASRDGTHEVLEPYQRALPMTVFRNEKPAGYPAAIERLVRETLARTDRPKRDYAVLLPADFGVSPNALPEMIRRLESGADVVVAETPGAADRLTTRLVRRAAPWLLRRNGRLGEIRDFISGCCAFRLVTLKLALGGDRAAPLRATGLAARAELIVRTANAARQIAVVTAPPPAVPTAETAVRPIALAVELFRTGRRLRLEGVATPSPRHGTA